MNILINSTNDSFPLFSLDNLICSAKVVSVYDGDTCTCNILLPNNEIVKYKVRLYGYDSPELKPLKSDVDRVEHIKYAKYARNKLIELTTDQTLDNDVEYLHNEIQQIIDKNKKIITLKCHSWDKYGRLLGTILDNDVSINELMIQSGNGYEYYGKTKNN